MAEKPKTDDPKNNPPKDDGDKVVKNEDGTVTVNGKTYIVKDSYDVVADKYKKAKEEKEKAKQKELEEQGKWKDLADQREAELNKVKAENEMQRRASALIAEASKVGVVDSDALVKLTDLSKVEVSEDGTVNPQSVKTLVEALKTEKPYLFGEAPKPTIGTNGGGAPQDNGGAGTFKRSQLRDGSFYQANRDAILLAQKEGKIIDDITPSNGTGQ